MIWAENVTKYYPTHKGRHYVLRDVSFYVPPLTKLGVIGRNGAGKSTLVRLLSGVDMPNEGRVVRQGHISWPLGLATGLHPSMTGRENARFACRIQGLGQEEIPAVLGFIQSFAEIGRYFDEPVRSYSSGMRARLNFAIAMAFDFDFYIIDELTAVGDEQFKHKSRQTFEEKRSQAGVIMVSHSLPQLREECQSGLLLHEGNAEYFDDIEGAIERYLLLQGLEERRKTAKQRKRETVAGSDAAEGGEEGSRKAKKRKKKAKKLAPLAGVKAVLSFGRVSEEEKRETLADADGARQTRRAKRAARIEGDVSAGRTERAKPARRMDPPDRAERIARRRAVLASASRPGMATAASAAAVGRPEPPRKPSSAPVGRAPFAPRMQRDVSTAQVPDKEASTASLTANHLLALLRGGSIRR